MNITKQPISVKIWFFCLIATLVSIAFLQVWFACVFFWIAVCIMSGSYEWFNWFSTNYEEAIKVVQAKQIERDKNKVVEKINTIKKIDMSLPKNKVVEKREIINCSCHSESIVVTTDNEYLKDTVEMAFWKYGHGANLSGFVNRITQIYKLLKYGHPYADMVILNKEEIQKLIVFLQDAIKEDKKD